MPGNSKEYNKTYYLKNKTERLAKLKQKQLCLDCKCNVSCGSLQRHVKSKKHIGNCIPKIDGNGILERVTNLENELKDIKSSLNTKCV